MTGVYRNQEAKCLAIVGILLNVSLALCPASAQDKYAVVVGVETYDTSTFENLDFANEDANGMGAALRNLGFKTIVMASDAPSTKLQPLSPAKIANVLKGVAASAADGDTLVVALSGHGVQFKDEPLLETGVRETYFCPGDADLSDKSTLLKISDVTGFLSRSKATRKLLLIDSCRETVLSTQGKKKNSRTIDLGSVHENRRSVPRGMAVLFSCSSNQFSWEHKPLGHSVFTHYVINYLQGKAEARFYDRQQVDLDGLVFYVRKRTNEYVAITERLSTDGQVPVLRGESANWPLGKLQQQSFVNSIGAKMTLIPAGSFLMGSPENEAGQDDDENQHRVELTAPFYMATTEVTQSQWQKVMGTTPWKGERYVKEGPSVAATYVSWEHATAFCRKLSQQEGRTYRLPTEAEWEYACRAGSKTAYSFGNDAGQLSRYGWWGGFFGDGNAKDERYAHEVGKKLPNAWGLYDMHGNVWEWCADWYGSDYYKASPTKDPRGPTVGSSRLLRGGGWLNGASSCRSASRYVLDPTARSSNFGFRLVCE